MALDHAAVVPSAPPSSASANAKLFDEALYSEVAEYLQGIGGRCRMDSLMQIFDKATDEFLRSRFDVSNGAKQYYNMVSLRVCNERIAQETDLLAQRVARQLFRVGGTANLHDITRRFGISKKTLLAHADGKLFEERGSQLRLAGGAFAVAAAAAVAGTVTACSGRRKARTDLFTSTGMPTNEAAARRLRLRIEGLLVSAGDGVLPAQAVYTALGLQPTPSIRRWFQRVGLVLTSNGDLKVPDHRLSYFRVRRALSVSALLSASDGEVPLHSVLSHIHRPPELLALEAEEQETLQSTRFSARPPGGGRGHHDYSSSNPSRTSAPAGTEQLALAISSPPLWVEEWIQQYFVVEAGVVTFPSGSSEKVRRRALPAVAATQPNIAEEEAVLMRVAEELRLRYGRVHSTVLAGCFEGVRQQWLQRFFDITPNGDVLPKSVPRQTHEAVAISRHVAAAPGLYTTDKAFQDLGATRTWLQAYFEVASDGALGFDTDSWRAWNPPPEDLAPSPWKYAKLEVPRGYIRKGNGRYLPRKYGHSAGGILY